MATQRVKSFSVSEPVDLEKVDSWWAGLLSNGPKELSHIGWEAKGDLRWTLKLTWIPIAETAIPFHTCMPAYSGLRLEDLHDLLESVVLECKLLKKNLKLFKLKIDDWGITENSAYTIDIDDGDYSMSDFAIDPTLSYAAKLETIEKVIASEFLWPSYKSMTQALLMSEARSFEIITEIKNRKNPDYTVVHVDRGMLRKAFRSEIGYDNRWLFATEEELFDNAKEA